MNYVRLGNSGLKISQLGLGAMSFGDKSWRGWVLDEQESRMVVRKALDHGINFFDTCDYYSSGVSEQILSKTLMADTSRQDIVLATKLGMNMGPGPNDRGFSRKHMFDAIDQSLKRLGTDYIDLYQTHIWDPSTNIEEMMGAFDDVIKSGKVLYIGTTDIPAWQLAKAQHIAAIHGWHRFVSVQNHYNLIFREPERELLPLCRDQGIGLIPYSPMGRGFLANNRREGDWGDTTRAKTDDFAQNVYFRETDFEVAKRTAEVADKRGLKPTQVALAWVLAQPNIAAPIFGATKPEHVDDAVDTLKTSLEAEDFDYLETAYGPRPI